MAKLSGGASVLALSVFACAGPANAAPSPSVTVTVTLTVTATATVDTAKVQSVTRSAIQGFLSQRANMITSTGPDTQRMHGRLEGTLFGDAADPADPQLGFSGDANRTAGGVFRPTMGGGGAFAGLGYGGETGSLGTLGRSSSRMRGADPSLPFGGAFGGLLGTLRDSETDHSRPAAVPFAFNGSAEDGMGRFSFATSLSKMQATAEAKEQEKLASIRSGAAALGLGDAQQDTRSGGGAAANGLGLGAQSVQRSASRPLPVDIWVEGNASYFVNDRGDGKRQGHAALLWTGVDAVVMPGLLVGVMGQFDWMSDSSASDGVSREGHGWMVGPYLSAWLTRNVYLDARALWGQSTNELNPLGSYTDTFTTSRALAAAKLSGDWRFGALGVRPSAEVIWFTEQQKAYTNAIGIDIAGQSYSLGRTMFGPEFSYRFVSADKSAFEPFVGLKGVWDFARTQESTAAGEPIGGDTVRGRLEAGATYRTPAGISVRALGGYDGIGSTGSYHAIQGQAQIVVPLQ
jgi:outer membrane autotransporter protein